MSIKSQIDRLKSIVSSAYNFVRVRGGNVPEKANSNNLISALESIPENLDTSDATATADFIGKDKTAYVDGQKIVGNIEIANAYFSVVSQTTDVWASELRFKYDFPSGMLFGKNSYVMMRKPLSYFGDAIASDVASSKTFTSSAGLKATGSATIAKTMRFTIVHNYNPANMDCTLKVYYSRIENGTIVTKTDTAMYFGSTKTFTAVSGTAIRLYLAYIFSDIQPVLSFSHYDDIYSVNVNNNNIQVTGPVTLQYNAHGLYNTYTFRCPTDVTITITST